MTKTALINAKEVAEILGTSKSHAYKLVQQLNVYTENSVYDLTGT
ncbi:helix-turn-helix transcriptional regulator [Anaerotignum sp.]|nr:hypothetical protein [Anaerotignum sp.]